MRRVIPPPPRGEFAPSPRVLYSPIPVEPEPTPARGARRFRALLEEFRSRSLEALRLYVPFANSQRFHQSQAKIRLLIGSNRSGKTNSSVADLAMVLTGTHPWGKWPKQDGRSYIVGWDEAFIGNVLAPKLLLPGAFQVIRDEITGMWRPVVPDDPYDAAYREKWLDAAPFIPPRMIQGNINWKSKKDFVPSDVTLTTGWKLSFFSSRSEPQRGNEIDDARISEEIENKTWPRELLRGLVKRSGRFTYEATPQSSSAWLYNEFQKAIAPGADTRRREAFFLHVKDNKYLSEQDRADFYDQLTEEERRVCWDGEFMLGGAMVYKTYSRDRHVIPSFEPPETWNRWMVVDPGVTTCAVTLWAIPPPMLPDGQENPMAYERHCYDELYLKGCSAEIFASKVKEKLGHRADGVFQGFVIDWHAARTTQIGQGTTVGSEYSEALRRHGVSSISTGYGFVNGSDNIAAREECLRRWMGLPFMEAPTPVLRIHDRCVSLLWELPQQFYKQGSDGLVITDQRVDRNNHAVTTAEYFAELNPYWMARRAAKVQADKVLEAFRKKQRQRQKAGEGGVSIGPPARAK